ncbi:hypothetical protein [Marinomonas sp. 2405UD68-3]|uniref:hypothetical protein n=1 Tax=Marinomonas sp. 2405UD68-3 TaxID=3391835 RepID=UPI0039C9087D
MAISIGALMTALASNYIIYFLGFVLIIAFDKMFNIFVRSLRVKVIPPIELGKTTGLIVLLNNMSPPLAGLIVASFVGFIDLQSIVIYLNIAAVLLGLGALNYAVSKVTSW